MSNNYEYKLNNIIRDPIEFRNLVKLVRDGGLGANDLVRAEWETEWHAAAEVVGLFHMAGRDDVLAIWEEQREKERLRLAEASRSGGIGADEFNEMMNTAELMPDGQKRLIEAEAERQAEARKRHDERRGERELERELERTRQGIGASISAAVDAAEAKDRHRQGGAIRKLLGDFFSQGTLHHAFRWGNAFVAGSLMAILLLNWSDSELQRYPEMMATAGGEKVFPYYGPCSPGEYLFLFFDAMVAAGIVGYGGAILLESMVDD